MQQPRQLSDVDIGFLKEAAANGYDVSFLTGYIDEFNDYQQKWASIVDAAVEEHGPMVRVQLGHDLAKLSAERGGCSIDDPRVQEIFNYIHKTAMVKQANPVVPDSGVAPGVEPVPETVAAPMAPNPNAAPMEAATPRADAAAMPWANAGGFKADSNAGWGGGMGGILGLILGQLLFKSPMLGALLGGAGGAGIGGMYGDKIKALLGGLFNKYNAGDAGPSAGNDIAASGLASPPAKLSNGAVDPSSDVASRIPPNKLSPEGQRLKDIQNANSHPDANMEYTPEAEPIEGDSQNSHLLATPEMTTPIPVEGTNETQAPTGLQMPPDLADIEKQVVARGAPPAKPPGVAGQAINPIAPVPMANPFRGANGQVDPAAVKRTLGGMSVDDTVAAGQRSRMGDVGGRTDMNLGPAASLAPGQVYGAQAAGKPIVPPQMGKKGSLLEYWLNKEAYTSSGSNPLMPQQQPQQQMASPQPQQPVMQPQQGQAANMIKPMLPPETLVSTKPDISYQLPGQMKLSPVGMQSTQTVGQQMPQPQPVNKTPQLDFNKQVHPLAI